MKPITIFVSYRHTNGDWVDAKGAYQLIPWLREQFSREQVEFWTDHALQEHIGEDYEKRLKQKIDEADIALLLITPEFAASSFILEKELPWIKERFDNKKIKIIPLLIDGVTNAGKQRIDWIFQLQMITGGGKTILERYEESRASYSKVRVSIADTIEKKVAAIRTNNTPPQTPPPPVNAEHRTNIPVVPKNELSEKDIRLKYDFYRGFSDGLAKVRLNGKYGYIDKTGKEVISLKYDGAYSFSDGLALVRLNGKYGYIDKTGKEVIPLKYDDVYDFSDDLAVVKLNRKYGYIDKTGKEVIPLKYDDVYDFSDDLAVVKLNGKYGYIDKTGKEAIPLKYDDANSFSEGLAVVKLYGKKFKINKSGERVK